VVSIKSSNGGIHPGGFRITRGRFVAQNVTVRLIVAVAYGVQPFRVSKPRRDTRCDLHTALKGNHRALPLIREVASHVINGDKMIGGRTGCAQVSVAE
jgi:hypothetical protein